MPGFDHARLTAPPTLAAGMFHVFAYTGVLLLTPALISIGATMHGKPLVPPLAFALDIYRWPIVSLLVAVRDSVVAVTQPLHAPWMGFVIHASDDAMLAAYAGGALVSSWNAARLQRLQGPVVAATMLIALTLFLGVTLLGIAFLLIAFGPYLSEVQGPHAWVREFNPSEYGIQGERDPNDGYITGPLLVSVGIAAVVVVGNALLSA